MRALAILCAALGACSPTTNGDPDPDGPDGGGTDGIAPMVTFFDISTQIIAPKCSGPSCHGPGATLSFSKRPAVIDADARSAECAGAGKIVVPGSPADSLLYTKLTGPPCGGLMPFSLEPLDAPSIETIRAWIAAGAP